MQTRPNMPTHRGRGSPRVPLLKRRAKGRGNGCVSVSEMQPVSLTLKDRRRPLRKPGRLHLVCVSVSTTQQLTRSCCLLPTLRGTQPRVCRCRLSPNNVPAASRGSSLRHSRCGAGVWRPHGSHSELLSAWQLCLVWRHCPKSAAPRVRLIPPATWLWATQRRPDHLPQEITLGSQGDDCAGGDTWP